VPRTATPGAYLLGVITRLRHRVGRARVLLLLVALGLVVVGCKVDATVAVRVRDDGSGVVRVRVVADAEAVKAVETGTTKIEDAIRLSDLSSAGWRVSPWARSDDGDASIVLTRRFSSVDEIGPIFEQISGPDGPLHDVRVTRDSGTFGVDYDAEGRIDLENVRTGVPTDPELVAALTAQQVDPNVIDQQLLAQVRASFGLKVVVKLPGQPAKTFTAEPGATTPIDASSSVTDTDRIAFVAAAIGFALLAVVVALRPSRRRRRRRRSA
jgi:hypothetical protein